MEILGLLVKLEDKDIITRKKEKCVLYLKNHRNFGVWVQLEWTKARDKREVILTLVSLKVLDRELIMVPARYLSFKVMGF